MNIAEILDPSIPDLKMTTSVGSALDLLDNCKVSCLPVVHNGLFVGMVSEENLFEGMPDDKIGGMHTQFSQPILAPGSSIFDCLKLFGTFEGDLIAVVEDDFTFHGVVSKNGLVNALSHTNGLQTDGAVIVLDIPVKDYNLTQISSIVEENDCKIVALLANLDMDVNSAQVFLKINSQNIAPILQSLERFDYSVMASFSTDPYKEDLKLRYEEFLKYLDM
ncbi:MAG: acetoin utilization protein AcuB [Sphingobacteriales bacterium]|jgi:acetoin utilization protein AcuB